MVDDHRVFVVHTREPRILAEVFLPPDKEKLRELRNKFEYGSSVDYPGKLIYLGAVWFEYSNELDKVMSRMSDWYHAYLKWRSKKNG